MERIDEHPVERHRRDALEVVRPLRHRSGQQREQVVDAGSLASRLPSSDAGTQQTAPGSQPMGAGNPAPAARFRPAVLPPSAAPRPGLTLFRIGRRSSRRRCRANDSLSGGSGAPHCLLARGGGRRKTGGATCRPPAARRARAGGRLGAASPARRARALAAGAGGALWFAQAPRWTGGPVGPAQNGRRDSGRPR